MHIFSVQTELQKTKKTTVCIHTVFMICSGNAFLSKFKPFSPQKFALKSHSPRQFERTQKEFFYLVTTHKRNIHKTFPTSFTLHQVKPYLVSHFNNGHALHLAQLCLLPQPSLVDQQSSAVRGSHDLAHAPAERPVENAVGGLVLALGTVVGPVVAVVGRGGRGQGELDPGELDLALEDVPEGEGLVGAAGGEEDLESNVVRFRKASIVPVLC